jgi:cellulose synthase/poly-beta-1,6-N-acetylglucosamine synthase-like glycosyltransferase
VRFDPRKMTEDIDASVRGLLRGFRIMQDRSIVSSELAPLDFRSFWFQRKRWAQGWLEVSIGYQRQFWRSPHFSIGQKLYWTYLLSYREAYPLITLQIFPVILSLLMLYGELPLFSHWFLWTSAIVTLLSGPYQTLSAARNAQAEYPRHYILIYASVVFFYVMVKNVISLVALYDHFTGQSEWVVTRRAVSEALRGRKEP